MKTTRIKPIFTFRLRDTMAGCAVFAGIMLAVMLIVTLGLVRLTGSNAQGTLSFYGIAACITTFVFGICTVRDDLRLALQLGTGRRSVFVAELLTAAITAIVLAVVGELLTALGALLARSSGLIVTDVYAMLYEESCSTLSFAGHVRSAGVFASLMLLAQLGGAFLSLMFYRLPKLWTIIVAVGGPLLLMNGLPLLFVGTGINLEPFFGFLVASPWNLVLCFVLSSLLVALFDWLLLRRAPVRAAK